MAQSKLEVHLQILKTVARNSPAKENKVAAQTEIAREETTYSLVFLTGQGLIEYEEDGYSITCRGLAVLKHFRMLNEQREIVEELNC